MSHGTQTDLDVIIIGSGPAGVSAAFPLVRAGLHVLMVDGGHRQSLSPPKGKYLDLRRQQENQWKWLIGNNFYALRDAETMSPKLRAPIHEKVFAGFQEANQIIANDFITVGSLAAGGLSNSWGCGVAALTDDELTLFPVNPIDMRNSYRDVARRIGISGGGNDDLSDYFGLDEWSQAPVLVDELQSGLLSRYQNVRETLIRNGFRLGHSRLAVLTKSINDRNACDYSGNCLWGCDRRALYSAIDDLRLLDREPNFYYRTGFVVRRVFSRDGSVFIEGVDSQGIETLKAKRVLLAAGTLATTRLALMAINHRAPVIMQSCPTAAFMLWLPRHLGRAHQTTFGLGQLSYTLNIDGVTQAFGSLFCTTGIPVTEFLRNIRFGKRYGLDILGRLLSSCVVGNLFLPGSLTDVRLHLDTNDHLVIMGKYNKEVTNLMKQSKQLLRNSFWKMGAVLLPTSFKTGEPGSDIHYAASLPMKANPTIGQTNSWGELAGIFGIHVVDGASLSFLPEKSHTLTIMANADRIAKHLAKVMISS